MPLPGSPPASFSGHDSSTSSETFAVDRFFHILLGGTTGAESLAQSITLSSSNPCVDACVGPTDERYETGVTFSDPAPVDFVFAGLGKFIVDVGGESLFDRDPGTAGISDSGALPFTVSFAAEDTPDADPGTPAVPLLLGGLGAASLAARRARARQP